ncbi:MAG: 16S rRNA (cytosine(1402)-N(4))-methyltransferase RsmH [Lachnospiraceae bacterium]|nr:16S rRNA (cytosine(1402)-N(4))-methyltransferase RsmH [Lachnospiraceae bacterium]
MDFSHRSVLLDEVIEGLNISPDGIYADGTLGGAGHSGEIARRLNGGHLYGFDQDDDAITAATAHLKEIEVDDRVTIIHQNYSSMGEEMRSRDVKLDGILLDLGVSSFQLDEQSRGFSYRMADSPLDMRMDRRQALTAATILNTYPKDEIARILRVYGEEKFAERIAQNIVRRREDEAFKVTGDLMEVIEASIPMKAKRTGGHPGKRTFQALRIEVNQELKVLEDSLDEMRDILEPGGRLCIITFHSLEDRIVKEAFKRWQDPCTCPHDFPACVCGAESFGKVITRKPIVAGEEELKNNSRSKSAKLRIFERGEGGKEPNR